MSSWTKQKPIAPTGDWYEVMGWIPLAVSVPVYDFHYGRGVVLNRDQPNHRWLIAFERGRNPDFNPDPEKMGALPWIGSRPGHSDPLREFDGKGIPTPESRNIRVNLEEPQGYAYAMRWYLQNTNKTAAERILVGDNKDLDRRNLAEAINELKVRVAWASSS